MNVNEVMSSDVTSCSTDTSLDQAARLMWDNDCGAVPVVNEKNVPVGIITDRDIAMAALHKHKPLWEMQVNQIIQGQHLCCCHQEDNIEGCLTKMEQNGVRRIMVTSQNGKLCGIVSMGDIVAATANRKSKNSLGPSDVLAMLKQVSAHHKEANRPVVSA